MKGKEDVLRKAEELGNSLAVTMEDPVEFMDLLARANDKITEIIEIDYGQACAKSCGCKD